MGKMDRIIRAVLWAAAVCLAGYLAGRGYMALRDHPSSQAQKLMEQAYQAVGEAALGTYLPGCQYQEGDKDQLMLAGIWENVEEHFPLFTYLKEQEPVETVVEDESTRHDIIAKNGDTITDRILAENQGQAVEAENQAAREDTSGTSTGEETGEEGGEADNSGKTTEGEETAETQTADASGQPGASGTETGTDQSAAGQKGTGTQTDQENAAKTEGQTSADGSEMPAWTTAVETSPVKDLSMEQLSDFNYLLNNFFVVDPNTTIDSSQMNASQLLNDDLKITGDSGSPQILIYHTHSQEGFADSVEGDENTSVIGVGNYLESILRDVFGYNVIHLKNTFDVVDGQIDRSAAYNYAQPVVQQVLDENPSIEVVIDLHRDGVPDDTRLVTEINGKPTAQVMYFNGLSYTVNNGALDSLPNPYITDNLAFSFQLSYMAARYYPQFTRCIYLKGYRYNLHMRPRSILLEVGAQTNTVQEAMNAMEPFSVILNKVLKGE